MAADAVEFIRLASPFIPKPASLEECYKLVAKNKDGALVIARWQSSLDPGTHRILMNE